MAEINFNYYHVKKSEQFSFFRIPKILYTLRDYSKLSLLNYYSGKSVVR